jgi:NADH:ubiquinone oxidoreductase subunit 6 (subunit J)
MNSLINIGMYLTYILVIIALIIIFYFAVMAIVKDFKNVKSSLFGILILLAVFVIAYLLSSSTDVSMNFFDKTETNPKYSKIIGSAVISLYILMLGVVGTLIYVQISRLLKK